jgi:hypothetical protein
MPFGRSSIGALSEYGTLAGGQHQVLRPPTELGGVGRWILYAVVAYLVVRLLATLFRGPSR